MSRYTGCRISFPPLMPMTTPIENELHPHRPIFAIFEGGGAKGIAHVGALQAVQDNRLEIVGVAGTSAGALVAVLVAIGLETSDIFNPKDPSDHILAKSSLTPTKLLGVPNWRRLSCLRRYGLWTAGAVLVGGLTGAVALTPRNAFTLAASFLRLGLFSTETITDFINNVIRNRLAAIADEAGFDWEIPDRVTFRDLARGWPTVVPLKIVVTDVDRGSLELFDAHSTPNVLVAEAVSASISIPVIFRPAEIPSHGSGRFADGGMVSNLPIWVFSEEKLAYERENYASPPVPIIGFSLQQTEHDKRCSQGGPFKYLTKLLNATLQGSQEITARFLDDVSVVPLEATLDLLDFDRPWSDYAAAYEAGRRSADQHLRFILEAKPERIRRELISVRDLTLNKQRLKEGGEEVIQLRVNLIRPFGQQSLRVMESVGMESDADDRLLLDRRGRGAAEAFRIRDVNHFSIDPKTDDPAPEYMTKYERALVRQSIRAVICVPIFQDMDAWALDPGDRPEPAGILAIDSDEPIASDFADNNLIGILVSQGAVLYDAVNLEVEDGKERAERNEKSPRTA